MSGMKDKESGDWAPSRAQYMDIGRFRLTPCVHGKEFLIRDTIGGEAGIFNTPDLEAALLKFFGENF